MKSEFYLLGLFSEYTPILGYGSGTISNDYYTPEIVRYSNYVELGNGRAAFGPFNGNKSVDSKKSEMTDDHKAERINSIKGVRNNADLKKWLSPEKIEELVKSKKEANKGKNSRRKRREAAEAAQGGEEEVQNTIFDYYYWVKGKDNKGEDQWDDIYPYVRPDVGWWMTRKIADYTVRLEYNALGHGGSRTVGGTGWFFDFVKPGGDQKYPTKWFLVTSASVVENLRIGRDPYDQGLPKHCIRLWWNVSQCAIDRRLKLYKDARMDSVRMPVDKDPHVISGGRGSFSEETRYKSGKWDALLNANRKYPLLGDLSPNEHPIYYTEVTDFDLFYFPKDFMDFSENIEARRFNAQLESKEKEKSEVGSSEASVVEGEGDTSGREEKVEAKKEERNYALDMVILEVDLGSELVARRMTNNLYDKYYKEGAKGLPLNFLSDKVEKPFRGFHTDKLDGSLNPFFTAMYSSGTLSPYRVYGNYSQTTGLASHPMQVYKGSAFNTRHLDWATQKYWRSSDFYFYSLSGFYGSKGSSGSMFVDIDGNVLGLVSSANLGSSVAYVSPIRNNKMFFPSEEKSREKKSARRRRSTEEGANKIFKPENRKFDLFGGVDGQKNSYLGVLKSIGMSTHMSETNKWDTKSEEEEGCIGGL